MKRLRAAVPEFADMIDQHLATYGELLAHLLFGDLARFALAAHERGDKDVVRRCFDYLEKELDEGDDLTRNLVKVSFVENIDLEDANVWSFVEEEWPPTLRAEATSQRVWRWGRPAAVPEGWLAVSESDDLEAARNSYLSWLEAHDLSESDLDPPNDLRIDQFFMRDGGRHWHRYRFSVRAGAVPPA